MEINLETVKSELEKLASIKVKAHNDILSDLLSQIQRVDFGESKQKGKVVTVIDEVLRLATQNNWGVCTRHGNIYIYNGAYWKIVEKERFQVFLGEAAERMGVDSTDAKYHKFRDELYKQFIAVGYR